MASEFELGGRTAVVTGGSQGLGLAIARALGGAGATVVIAGRRREILDEAVEGLSREGIVAAGFAIDVSDFSGAEALARFAVDSFGAVDVLVNNVGGSFGDDFQTGLLLDTGEADLMGVIRQNVSTTLNCCKAMVPQMLERGSGSVINISSVVVAHPMPGVGLYAASKAMIVSLTRTMAAEWGPKVRANALLVGYIDTPRTAPLRSPELRDWLGKHIAMGRLGRPDEVAGIAVYLASDASIWTTGAAFPIDGGVGAI